MQPFGDRRRRRLLGAGEALGVGEFLAIVDDVDAEAGVGGDSRQMPADVAGADDEEPRRRRRADRCGRPCCPPQISPFSCAKSSFSS